MAVQFEPTRDTALTHWIWGNDLGASLDNIFRENILKISQEYAHPENKKFIDNCLNALIDEIGNLYFIDEEAIKDILLNFNLIADRNADATKAKWIKAEFKKKCNSLVKKWPADSEKLSTEAAQCFYRILYLSDPKRIKAVQYWTERFVTAIAQQMEQTDVLFPFLLIEKTQNAFRNYYQKAIEQEEKKLLRIQEQDPEEFQKRIDVIQEKRKTKLSLLSPEEKEFLEFVGNQIAAAAANSNPYLIVKTDLCNACISSGLKLILENRVSITRSEMSQNRFAEILSILDKFQQEHLYQFVENGGKSSESPKELSS